MVAWTFKSLDEMITIMNDCSAENKNYIFINEVLKPRSSEQQQWKSCRILR